MKIEITKVTDWERVVDAARFTQRKEPLGKEPSDEFKKQMILSEHSPLRLLEFDIKMYGIPYWVSNHFVATFTLSHSSQPPDRILLAPRYLATICVRMIWSTCSYPSTLRRLSISPNLDCVTRHPRRQERYGIRCLTSWLA